MTNYSKLFHFSKNKRRNTRTHLRIKPFHFKTVYSKYQNYIYKTKKTLINLLNTKCEPKL